MRQAVRLYRIEELVEVTGVTRRTLRAYREAGLIEPVTREHRAVLFAEDTADRVQRIQRLRADLGVNLAGVQVILDMRERIVELQDSLEEVVEFVRNELKAELEHHLRRERKAVIPKPLVPPPGRPLD